MSVIIYFKNGSNQKVSNETLSSYDFPESGAEVRRAMQQAVPHSMIENIDVIEYHRATSGRIYPEEIKTGEFCFDLHKIGSQRHMSCIRYVEQSKRKAERIAALKARIAKKLAS